MGISMRVYVVMEEQYHEHCSIVAVCTTMKEAIKQVDQITKGTTSKWEYEYGPVNPDNKRIVQPGKGLCVCWLRENPVFDWYSIYEWDVTGEMEEPIQNFALSVLREDPSACDAVRDILRL